jgi:DNA-directed RNA polymerase subunit M/transcription elongation factor TFIIS
MTELADYTDARALHPDYRDELCPACGTERWFKYLGRDGWITSQWNCQTCGAYLHDVLEHPCPDCGTRMHVDGATFVCAACNRVEDFPKGDVLSRLSSDAYPARAHKPGVMAADCPLCDDGHVNGGADGELTCTECGFYAGQYSDSWYCFGLWLESPDRIRVVGYDD